MHYNAEQEGAGYCWAMGGGKWVIAGALGDGANRPIGTTVVVPPARCYSYAR